MNITETFPLLPTDPTRFFTKADLVVLEDFMVQAGPWGFTADYEVDEELTEQCWLLGLPGSSVGRYAVVRTGAGSVEVVGMDDSGSVEAEAVCGDVVDALEWIRSGLGDR